MDLYESNRKIFRIDSIRLHFKTPLVMYQNQFTMHGLQVKLILDFATKCNEEKCKGHKMQSQAKYKGDKMQKGRNTTDTK